jgi:hypothetical protein
MASSLADESVKGLFVKGIAFDVAMLPPYIDSHQCAGYIDNYLIIW